jgi:signal peptide peptidase SppA
MSRLNHVAQRVFNVPLAIHPGKAAAIVLSLGERFGVDELLEHDGRAMAFDSGMLEASDTGAYEVIAGIAVIPVSGTLVAKSSGIDALSGVSGYNAIRLSVMDALHDSMVQGIALDIDSGGGEVAGLFDLVDTIYAARAIKPIRAILTENAFSAAYAIASAAERISVPRTGGAGSIGVISMHVDYSRAIDKAGLTVTMIRHGERKFEGSQYEPLSKDAKAGIQADVDAVGELFLETVARNRGMTVAAVAATKAACFMGADALALDLVDAVEAPDAAFHAMLADL